MENLTNSLGKKFLNNKLEEVLAENSVSKMNYIGLFFTGSWCPPCELFANDLVTVYNEANMKEKVFEVVQISNEKSEKDFKTSISDSDRPWLFLPYGDPAVVNLVSEYKVTHLPMLIIVNKDKVLLSETGRNDVVENGTKAYEKWYKLYRQQKEREKELLEQITNQD